MFSSGKSLSAPESIHQAFCFCFFSPRSWSITLIWLNGMWLSWILLGGPHTSVLELTDSKTLFWSVTH